MIKLHLQNDDFIRYKDITQDAIVVCEMVGSKAKGKTLTLPPSIRHHDEDEVCFMSSGCRYEKKL
ncbi:hypothetical protein [Melghiribacillus thermohalophilus]|uniref:hypothetical protein n=1 Tax=Melghiribacillus thermohalophilus TaxID=1324956 RepID=UPI00104BFCE6|nr:hypothetical protein [Melghiribacillus thermohalophilus]